MAQKSLFITYLLWLLGGWFGLHHFYLRRDRQAFVWFASLGGVCGLGWFRDLYRIPEYVADANDDELYIEDLTQRMQSKPVPPYNMVRFVGEIFFGSLLSFVVRYAVPIEYFDMEFIKQEKENVIPALLVRLVTPAIAAYGVHICGNIGREAVSYKWSLAGSYLSLVIYGLHADNHISMSLISAIVVNWKGKSWRRTPYQRRHFIKRVTILSIAGLIYLTLWGSVLYYNASVTTNDGETVKLKDAIHHFFTSPAWIEFSDSLSKLYDYYKIHGFNKFWEEIVKQLDPQGEKHAYQVLNLSESSTQEEITKRYRKLARQWHPDKQRDPVKKAESHEMFIEIQQAYETISSIQTKRSKRNNRKVND